MVFNTLHKVLLLLSLNKERDSLLEGSMIPIIKEGIMKGYSVIVMNPNMDELEASNPGKEYIILKRVAFLRNATRVWDDYVSKCATTEIFILAHSYGGVAVIELLKSRDDFKNKVKGKDSSRASNRSLAIAFTDSVHDVFDEFEDAKQMRRAIDWLQDHAINFVASPFKIGTPIEERKSSGCLCVSSGTEEHTFTTQSSQDEIFQFFGNKRGANIVKTAMIVMSITAALMLLWRYFAKDAR